MASNFAIHPVPQLAPAALVEAFREVVTPHISDNLQRLSGVTGLTRFHRSKKLVGTAFTVKARPGDNLLIYKALMELQPGHVLVVDGGGDCTNALIGELIMLYAQQRGCAGFVLDGAIRDTAAFYEADFPCYARGTSHRGPYKLGPGAMNVPVSIGGQVISPGDLIVGDEDGVVSFPAAQATALLEAVQATVSKEDAIKDEIATGRREQGWLEAVLAPHGLLG
ncbi:methyltransferase [Cupriavidus sp. TA19]|uniref:RraA family protein n=1 Tax=unclassified Cupriavidus TaxID=2640874 RepID=UPI000EED365B|nr:MULTISPECIES: RraA family protein [unclassified Cupriavidus]BDB24087.1 RraA family protein [Cupriavidus sp. P-10]GLC92790.1 methyltransferase [Cupriavidus sp. TA19]